MFIGKNMTKNQLWCLQKKLFLFQKTASVLKEKKNVNMINRQDLLLKGREG